MSTIINTPATTEVGSGLGLIVGLLIVAGATLLFMLYGLPAIRYAANNDAQPTTNIDVTLPAPMPTPAPVPAPTPSPVE